MCIRYFDSKGLHDFLFSEEKLDDGCLQKFIQPKGAYNTMIQAAWSPQMCLLERRVNVNPLRNGRIPLLQRTATYDGDEHLSQITPVRGTLLADRIQQLCLAMVNHIKVTSQNRQTISRMLLNFKCDADDNIWFLWCAPLHDRDIRFLWCAAPRRRRCAACARETQPLAARSPMRCPASCCLLAAPPLFGCLRASRALCVLQPPMRPLGPPPCCSPPLTTDINLHQLLLTRTSTNFDQHQSTPTNTNQH